MLETLTVRTPNKAALRPLLKSALGHERNMLGLGLKRTRERLAEFERRFGMTSLEFERRLNAAQLDETVEFTDWRMEIGMLRLLEQQDQALRDATLD